MDFLTSLMREQLLKSFQKDLIMRIITSLEISKESLKLMKTKVIVNLKKVKKILNKDSNLEWGSLVFLQLIKIKKMMKNKKL